MRTLTDHIVDGDSANHQLTIETADGVASDGANHRYRISGFDTGPNSSEDSPYLGGAKSTTVLFQKGPIREVGVNGITHESLLTIIIDRLRSYQAGPFASPYNGTALAHCEAALFDLQNRTRERIARNVEGTHQK